MSTPGTTPIVCHPVVIDPSSIELNMELHEAANRLRTFAVEIETAAGLLNQAAFLADMGNPHAVEAAQDAIAKLHSLMQQLDATSTNTLFVLRLELPRQEVNREPITVCGQCGEHFYLGDHCPSCSRSQVTR